MEQQQGERLSKGLGFVQNDPTQEAGADAEADYMDPKFLIDAPAETGASCARHGRGHSGNGRERFGGVTKSSKGKKDNVKIAPLKERMKESVLQGMQKPIGQESKGFQLLAKMGYREGKGLGKEESGRVEPLAVSFNERREGIGVSSQRQEIFQQKIQQGQRNQERFRSMMSSKFEDRLNEKDVHKARNVIETLDLRKGIERHWMWFPAKIAKASDSQQEPEPPQDAFAELEVVEALDAAVHYLRETHLYCLYCADEFSSAESLNADCPGKYREAH